MGEQHIGILIGPIPPNGQQPPPIPLKVFPKNWRFILLSKISRLASPKNLPFINWYFWEIAI